MATKKRSEQTENKARTKVAIVGSASSSVNQTPWEDESVEIWGLAWRKLKRADRYFDVHGIGPHRKRVPPNYEEQLSSLGKPVYLPKAHPSVPNSVTYPLKEIMADLTKTDPYAKPEYFASSIAYMLGLAIYEKYEEIQLFGVDLIADDEYAIQRPNTEYLIGLARGRGIKVYIPEESALLKFDHLYGLENPPGEGPITQDSMRERIRQYKEKHEKAIAEAYTADGARQEAEQILTLLKHASRGGVV